MKNTLDLIKQVHRASMNDGNKGVESALRELGSERFLKHEDKLPDYGVLEDSIPKEDPRFLEGKAAKLKDMKRRFNSSAFHKVFSSGHVSDIREALTGKSRTPAHEQMVQKIGKMAQDTRLHSRELGSWGNSVDYEKYGVSSKRFEGSMFPSMNEETFRIQKQMGEALGMEGPVDPNRLRRELGLEERTIKYSPYTSPGNEPTYDSKPIPKNRTSASAYDSSSSRVQRGDALSTMQQVGIEVKRRNDKASTLKYEKNLKSIGDKRIDSAMRQSQIPLPTSLPSVYPQVKGKAVHSFSGSIFDNYQSKMSGFDKAAPSKMAGFSKIAGKGELPYNRYYTGVDVIEPLRALGGALGRSESGAVRRVGKAVEWAVGEPLGQLDGQGLPMGRPPTKSKKQIRSEEKRQGKRMRSKMKKAGIDSAPPVRKEGLLTRLGASLTPHMPTPPQSLLEEKSKRASMTKGERGLYDALDPKHKTDAMGAVGSRMKTAGKKLQGFRRGLIGKGAVQTVGSLALLPAEIGLNVGGSILDSKAAKGAVGGYLGMSRDHNVGMFKAGKGAAKVGSKMAGPILGALGKTVAGTAKFAARHPLAMGAAAMVAGFAGSALGDVSNTDPRGQAGAMMQDIGGATGLAGLAYLSGRDRTNDLQGADIARGGFADSKPEGPMSFTGGASSMGGGSNYKMGATGDLVFALNNLRHG